MYLNDIFHLSKEEIENSKIEFNMKAGRGGQPFLDRWLKCPKDEKVSGTCKECSFWGWYSKTQRNFSPGKWVLSFARISDNEWLFISAGKANKVPKDDWAEVDIIDRFKPFFGRLIIKIKKGQTFARYTFDLSTYIDQIEVEEILPCIYSGEKFEGYDRVNLPYHRLSAIFNGEILPTYYEALKNVTGVYCLTDTKNGKLYIGSATGGDGVAQRWGNYLDSQHGGNKRLMDLYKKEGKEYFEKHFTYTLLEYFGLSYDPEKIRERERYWKTCLDTVRNGYNDNY